MADPISLTLAAAAFVEPAIRATYQAYSLIRLSRSFGPDFKEYCRKLDGQKARLEEWSQWPIGTLLHPEEDVLPKVVVAELAAMQCSLARCAAIRSKYETDGQANGDDKEPIKHSEKKSFLRKWSTTSADNVSKWKVRPESGSNAMAHSSDPSTSFGSRSDETGNTSVHVSFLDPNSGRSYSDAMVQKVASQQRQDTDNTQSSAGFRKRAMWIAKDREEYKTSIKAIAESNDLIERLVRTRALKCLHSVTVEKASGDKETYQNNQNIPTVHGLESPTLPADDKSCIEILTRLHGALIQSRKTKEGEAMANAQFGLKASLDHSVTKENLLADFEELPFRTGSQVYLLQALKSSEANESTLLLAESLIEPCPTRTTLPVLVDGLDPFVHVGDFDAAPCDMHRLYKDTTCWASTTSLQDLIGTTGPTPSPKTRFRLAALLATTHLHSAGLPYTPGRLNPENFKYFDFSSEVKSVAFGEMLDDEDRLLSLYYFSGIGSVRPKISTRGIGAFKGRNPMFDVATTELGLLLYQIGSWQRLEYSGVSSALTLERLRGTVKQRVHELHREAGLRYAETVEKCLEWRHKPGKEREAELPRLYNEIIKSLKDLDEEFQLGSFNVVSPHEDHRLEKR